MSGVRTLEYVSRTLVGVLARRFSIVFPHVTVQVASPVGFSELESDSEPRVALFLYSISRNAELANATLRRLPNGQLRRQPLALELGYLVTAWAPRVRDGPGTDPSASYEEQMFLGLVLQTLYDFGEIGQTDLIDTDPPTVWTPDDSLQVTLDSLSVEEQYRIWDAVNLPYRLSLAYRVRVAGIDSIEVASPTRVAEAGYTVGGST